MEIRNIISEELNKELRPIKGGLEALRNDIKEIYGMIADLQKSQGIRKTFQKLTIEQKPLELHSELIEAARQAGVTLPNH